MVVYAKEIQKPNLMFFHFQLDSATPENYNL